MLKRFVALGLVGLFLVISLVVAQDSVGPYNRVADVNKDGLVDVLDLVEVGQAYGSNYTLASIPNKTVITVLSFARNPPEMEEALVAVGVSHRNRTLAWSYTNSSGVAVFDLGPNASQRAYAWSGSAYNYADFSTNSQGEASVLILLGEPTVTTIRRLPSGLVFYTLINGQNGSLYWSDSPLFMDIWTLSAVGSGFPPLWSGDEKVAVDCHGPINYAYSAWGLEPNTSYGMAIIPTYSVIGSAVFQTDADSSANVIVYVVP